MGPLGSRHEAKVSSGRGPWCHNARMSGMREGWFIADADGVAIGPLSRAELVAQHERGLHGVEAMAWHVEIAEWRPLERIAAATAPEMRAPQTTAAERAEARAE